MENKSSKYKTVREFRLLKGPKKRKCENIMEEK